MKNLMKLALAVSLMAISCGVCIAQKPSQLPLADPNVLLDNGVYYAYGTHSPNGIEVWSSRNLKSWKYETLALDKKDSYGDKNFWAPEVYKIGETYYMYYSAEGHTCVATSKSPLGPFVQDVQQPMIDHGCIDNSLFIDDDGTPYMFFVYFNDGNQVYMVELEKDYKTVKMETLHHILHAELPWELIRGKVAEGPFVVKHNGTYYLTYSVNDYRSQDYAIGCATTKDIRGAWTKYPEPVYKRVGNLVGVGHHSIFKDRKGDLRIIFHAHKDQQEVHPRYAYFSGVYFVPQSNGDDLLRIDYNHVISPKVKK